MLEVRVCKRLGETLIDIEFAANSGITLMIGGNIIGKTNTISLEIYNSVMDADFARASFLCLVLGVISLGVFFALRRMSAL